MIIITSLIFSISKGQGPVKMNSYSFKLIRDMLVNGFRSLNKAGNFLNEYLNLVAIFEEDLIRGRAIVGEIKLRELVLERVERDEFFEVGRDRQQPPEFRLERGDEAVEGGNELGLKKNND